MSGARRQARRLRYEEGSLGLALAVLEGGANLRGARCVDHRGEFDPDVPAEALGFVSEVARWHACADVCRQCPARGACWQWASGLRASERPRGPLADTRSDPFSSVRSRRVGPEAASPDDADDPAPDARESA